MFGPQLEQEESGLEIVRLDLTDEKEVQSALEGSDAVIWCATGFSDSDDGGSDDGTAATTSFVGKVKMFFGLTPKPKPTSTSTS